MTLRYVAIVAALALAPAAFAQNAGQQEPQIKPTGPGPGAAQETSDRTPGKETQTPQNQIDTFDHRTSDRSGNKDVKVDHQPAAAGTAGTATSSEGASTGTAGPGAGSTSPAAMPSASSNSNADESSTSPSTTPPASSDGAQ